MNMNDRGKKSFFKRYHIKNYNFRLVAYVVILTAIGIAVIGSANEDYQSRQLLGLVIGLVVMAGVSLIDYSFLVRFGWLFYILNIVLLVMVHFFGHDSNNARRWVEIAGIRFQPSELGKILLILFFAWFFMRHSETVNTVRIIGASLILAGIPLVLVVRQPDLSTTIVTFLIFTALLFIAGLSYKIILAVLAITVPTVMILLSLVLQPDQHIIEHFQWLRIQAWLHPEDYPDVAMQQLNSITAIGSGQLIGKGLYNTDVTSVKNGNFIPEPQTDFIFAIVGEELGFIGSAIIIILLFLITLECILMARKAKDLAGRLICGGMAALVGFQSFMNIGVTTGLLPNTGLPLPFVSYGLTSLVTLFLGIGLVLNVGMQPRKY